MLWVARSYLESLSSAKTSLTRCFDTAVPGHSNLLRPSPQVSTDFRRRLEQLGALHSQQDYGSDLLDKCCLVELLVALNRAVAEAAAQPADCTCDRVVDQVVGIHQRALQRAADAGRSVGAVFHQQVPPAAQV